MKLDPKKLYLELRPELQKLEQERLIGLRKIRPFKLFFQICMAAVFVLTIHMVFFDGFTDAILVITIVSFILGILVYGIKYGLVSSKLKQHFQREIVSRIIQNLGPEFSYQPDGKIPEAELRRTQLFGSFNRYQCEDLVSGMIGNKAMQYAEVLLELYKKTNSSGSQGRSTQTTTTPVFQGIFLSLQLKNTFPAPFWIVPAKWYLSFGSKMRGNELVLDHPEFHKVYKVVSGDPELTKKLLIQPIRDKLILVYDDLKSHKIIWKPVSYAFMENYIYAAIPIRKHFMEISIRKTIDSEEFLEEQLSLINSIHEVGELFG